LRFIHTADWQIGKFFKQFGGKEDILRRARLDAIDAIGRFAAEKTIPHVQEEPSWHTEPRQ
jgi:DNA repair exonuclease SbcCD nuclease subunit